jgi:hypothetical protein
MVAWKRVKDEVRRMKVLAYAEMDGLCPFLYFSAHRSVGEFRVDAQ